MGLPQIYANAGVLLEPAFHDVGVSVKPRTQTKETQIVGEVRAVQQLTQGTQTFFDEEQIARRSLQKNHFYAGSSNTLVSTFFHHKVSCLRRPAGRADKNGSQQAAFSMEVPSMEPFAEVLIDCDHHPQARYSSDPKDRLVSWIHSPNIDNYYVERAGQLSDFFGLHVRGLERGAHQLLPSSFLSPVSIHCAVSFVVPREQRG
eukprot:6201217-Pleurochrysis_carterae.AAC.2